MMNLDIKKFQEYLNAENLSKEQIDWLELMYIKYPGQINQYFKEELKKIDPDKLNIGRQTTSAQHAADELAAKDGSMDPNHLTDQDANKILSSLLQYTDKENIGEKQKAVDKDIDQKLDHSLGDAHLLDAAKRYGSMETAGAAAQNTNSAVVKGLVGSGMDKQDRVMANTDQLNLPNSDTWRLNSFRTSVYRMAAVVIILILSAYFVIRYLPELDSSKELPTAKVMKAGGSEGMQAFYNFKGVPTDLTLPDGSKVQLMASSLIRWPDNFGVKSKQVYLNGAALFTVNRDEQKDFSVITQEVEIKDLGTVFLVKNNKDALYVKLLKGKVMVSARDKKLSMEQVALKPGEVFQLNKLKQFFNFSKHPSNKDRPVVVKKRTQPKSHSQAASTVQLIFKNEALKKVLRDVALKYDRKIVFNDSTLKGKSFTGDLSNIKNMDQVLQIICFTNGLQYQLKADSILIQP